MIRPTTIRNGFTLLEVLLALFISGMVVAAVAAAVDFHLRALDTARRDVEEAQLARAILRRMADDLRTAVRHEPVDVDAMLGSVAVSSADLEAASAAAGSSLTNSAAASAASEAVGGDDDSSSDESGETENVPGLYGSQYDLQVDVSRLPRVDQYDQLLALGAQGVPADPVSDVKTVTYYLMTEYAEITAQQSPTSESLTMTVAAGTSGLVRRERDRAVSDYALTQGDYSLLEELDEVLAPEVVALEFRYFDGTEWALEWNSTERGGLPMAVEIAMQLKMPELEEESVFASFGTEIMSTLEQNDHTYRLLVHLPSAEPTSLDDATATDEEAASSSSTTGESP